MKKKNSRKYDYIFKTLVHDFVDNLPLLHNKSCWFQLDVASAHCTAEVSSELWKWDFTPKFPDITSLNFYRWGTFKEKVYIPYINTNEELENRVHQTFQLLDPNEIRREFHNYRVHYFKVMMS